MRSYDVDGKFYPCQFFMPLSVGKEKAETANKIVFPKDVISNELLDEKCRDCIIKSVCPNCFGANYAATGNIYSRDNNMCKLTKITLKARSYFRAKQWEQGQLKGTNEEIQAILCDEAWFQIYENIMRFDEFYNARVMAWNEYLHVWQTYAICPFANAVVLATAQPKPATAISVGDVNVVKDATANVTVTLTPTDATSELTFISGDETVFTVSTTGVVTGVSAGTGTLTVKTDNGLSDTATVTVTG